MGSSGRIRKHPEMPKHARLPATRPARGRLALRTLGILGFATLAGLMIGSQASAQQGTAPTGPARALSVAAPGAPADTSSVTPGSATTASTPAPRASAGTGLATLRLPDLTGAAQARPTFTETAMPESAAPETTSAAAARSLAAAPADWDLGVTIAAAKTPNPTAALRPGDQVTYTVTVTNTGVNAWTRANPAKVSLDIADLLDDARITNFGLFARAGNAPTLTWSGELAAGKSQVLTLIAQVDDFRRGDDRVRVSGCVSGAPAGAGIDPIERCAENTATLIHSAADLEVTQSWAKVSGSSGGDLVPGDVIQFFVTVKNTGDLNLIGPNSWSPDRRANVALDLSGVLDDAAFGGAISGVSSLCSTNTSWNPAYCPSVGNPSAGGMINVPMTLAPGGIQYLSARAVLRNDFTGDLTLNSRVEVSVDTGDTTRPDGAVLTRGAAVSPEVTPLYPELTMTQVITKVAGSSGSGILPGDIIQIAVRATNTGKTGWTAPTSTTADKLLSYSQDLSGFLDDVTFGGANQGTSGNCQPINAWDGNYCANAGLPSADGKLSMKFSLPAGATQAFNIRGVVRNDFAGDQRMRTAVQISGESGNQKLENGGRIVLTKEDTLGFDRVYPEAEMTQTMTKVAGSTGTDLLPGDVVQIAVRVKNPAKTGWTDATSWSVDKRLTYVQDLSGFLDDVTYGGANQGTSGNCQPINAWDGNYCANAGLPGPDGKLSMTFSLPAGTTQAFNIRGVVRNDYPGDQRIVTSALLTGNPRDVGSENDGRITRTAQSELSFARTFPELEMTQTMAKVTGSPGSEILPGDTVQIAVRVKNPSKTAWTGPSSWSSDKRLTYTQDLGGFLDDVSLVGALQGTSGNCQPPASWDYNYCPVMGAVGADGKLTSTFSLAAGTTQAINIRGVIRNDFPGDQNLRTTATVTGNPGDATQADGGVLTRTAQATLGFDRTYPEAELTQTLTKVSGSGGTDLLPGDVVQVAVRVKNPGKTGWTGPSSWSVDKRLTYTQDLSGFLDDVTYGGAQQGVSGNCMAPNAWDPNYCPGFGSDTSSGKVTQTFALAAGTTQAFNIRGVVHNGFTGDQLIRTASVVTGNTGDTTRADAGVITRAAQSQLAFQRTYPELTATQKIVKVSGSPGTELRTGDSVQISLRISNPGKTGWTGASSWSVDKRLRLSQDLSGFLDDASWFGSQTGIAGPCQPDNAWQPVYCTSYGDPTEAGKIDVTFPLGAGTTQAFTIRGTIRNDVPGDQILAALSVITGETGNPDLPEGGRLVRELRTETPFTAVFPEMKLGKQWAKVSGSPGTEIRPGDVLQYGVAITNPSNSAWTAPSSWAADRRITVTQDLSGVLDDAVFLGSRVGASAACANPTSWNSDCAVVDPKIEGTTLTHTFPLPAGATMYVAYRVQVSDRYAGDLHLTAHSCASGDSGNKALPDGPRITQCADWDNTISRVYPELGITQGFTKAPNSSRPLRAGDVGEYTITIKNPGQGGWNAASNWAAGNQVTLSEDLGDILDDGALVGAPTGGATVVDNRLSWSGPLAAGGTKVITFRVQIMQQPAAGGTTPKMLDGEACVSGDSRNPGVIDPILSACDRLKIGVGENWRMNLSVTDQHGAELTSGSPVRPGDRLTYRIRAEAIGGWPVEGVQIQANPSQTLGVAELTGDPTLTVGSDAPTTLKLASGRVTTPRFELPGDQPAVLAYTVTVPEDLRRGTLRDEAIGTAEIPGIGTIAPATCGPATQPCAVQLQLAPAAPWVSGELLRDGEAFAGTALRGERLDYRLTVENPGPGAWSERAPLAVDNTLAGVLDDATPVGEVATARIGDGPEFEVPMVDGHVRWSGALAAGEKLTLTYPVTVNARTGSGDRSLLNRICAGESGENAPRVCAEVTTPILSAWTLSKVALDADGHPLTAGAVVTGGDIVRYEITARWLSGNTAEDVVLHDSLAGVLASAELVSPPTLRVGEGSPITVNPSAARQLVTPAFDLARDRSAVLSYAVRVAEGQHGGTLRNDARGSGVNAPARCAVGDTDAGLNAACRTELVIVDDRVSLADPIITQAICLPEGGVSVPDVRLPVSDGVRYEMSGDLVAGGSVTVTATSLDGRALRPANGWTLAADKTSAFRVITLSLPDCTPTTPDPGPGTDTPATPEDPSWPTAPVCTDGEPEAPWINVPVTPGIFYTIAGEVAFGHTVTITAHAREGFALVVPPGWVPAEDGKTAHLSVSFPDAPDCGSGGPETPGTGGGNDGGTGPGGGTTPAQWSIGKHAENSSGAPIGAGTSLAVGDAITYEVRASARAENRSPVTGIVLTDDLSQVLGAARLDGDITLKIGDREPIRVEPPQPGSSWLRTPAFDLSPGESAVLRYRVVITTTSAQIHEVGLINRVWGTGSSAPASCTSPTDETEGCATTTPIDPPGDGGGTGNPGTGGGDSPDPEHPGTGTGPGTGPGEGTGTIPAAPRDPAITEPGCVAGVYVRPTLSVLLTPGIWYEVTGEFAPGKSVVITAHAEAGYRVEPRAGWVSAADRLTATKTVTFPASDCPIIPEDPRNPTTPGTPTTPTIPTLPAEPGLPSVPHGPGDPLTPAPVVAETRLSSTGGGDASGSLVLLATGLLAAGLLLLRRRGRA